MNILNDQDHPTRIVFAAKKTGKTAFCRCWKSKKMPLCDGSHKCYNQASKDNLGPLVINWEQDAK